MTDLFVPKFPKLIHCNFAQRTELVAAKLENLIYLYKLVFVQINFDGSQTFNLIGTTYIYIYIHTYIYTHIYI
jgi:hypothetical protein